jgi:hypothetical protein
VEIIFLINWSVTFTELMNVDLQPSIGVRMPPVIVNDTNKSTLRLQRLDLELASLAKDMIRVLGESQGPKYAAISIDTILSDFFEATSSAPSAASAYLAWLHDWVGGLVVARELLIGAFSPRHNEASRLGSKNLRKSHILRCLAVSILPLVVQSDFWGRVMNDQQLYTREGGPKPAPRVLEANASVAVLLFDLVQTFCNFMKPDDVDCNLCTLLLPLLEVASHSTFGLVREASIRSLTTIAISLGRNEVEDLVFLEQHRLVASMMGRLRLTQAPGEDATKDILTIAGAMKGMLEYLMKASVERNDNRTTTSRGPVVDLMALLDRRLSQVLYEKSLSYGSLEVVCSLHRCFFEYFLHAFRVEKSAVYSYRTRDIESESQNDWLDKLYKFRKSNSVRPIHEEFPQNARREREHLLRFLDVSANEIEIFSTLIARNCTLLSNQNLSIRISSCQGLLSAFRFLAFVGTVHEV